MPKKNQSYCYLNGRIISESKGSLSLSDVGVLRAYAVFDVMYARNEKPFMLKEHWNRLKKSADTLKLKLPIKETEFQSIVVALLKKNKFLESSVRAVLTGGVGADGYNPGKETFYVLVTPFHGYPKSYYEKGVKMITLEYQRILPEVKTTHYSVAVRHESKKKQAGAVEILYTQNGKALEAATSNVFAVKNGKIITPREDILNQGTTRNAVIRLLKKSGIPIEERAVSLKEFLAADEVFLAATNKNVVPVVKIDNRIVGKGKVGNWTKVVMDLFSQFKDDQLA